MATVLERNSTAKLQIRAVFCILKTPAGSLAASLEQALTNRLSMERAVHGTNSSPIRF
jgi:hypothetical protein